MRPKSEGDSAAHVRLADDMDRTNCGVMTHHDCCVMGHAITRSSGGHKMQGPSGILTPWIRMMIFVYTCIYKYILL